MVPDLYSLWEEYKEKGNEEARSQLILHYAYLAKYVANRLAISLSSVVELDELISYAIEGLIDAVDKYDHKRGIKFETYALTRIKGAMIDGLRAMDWVPSSVRKKSKELEQAYVKAEQDLGRPPTDEEMAERLGITLEQFRILLRDVSATTIVYLEDFLAGDESGEKARRLGELMKDEQAESALDMVEISETKAALAEAIRKLPDKEKLVVFLYYYDGLTLKEIGEVMGLSESRISQLHTKAILRLRGRLSRRKSAII